MVVRRKNIHLLKILLDGMIFFQNCPPVFNSDVGSKQRLRMKHYLIIVLTAISFSVAGQKSIYLYFNDAGFCGPGPLITEELTLFSDSSFEYFAGSQYPNIGIEASGHFSKKECYISLKYENIKIDTLDKSKETTIIFLISEFKVIRDKEWIENKGGMLIEFGKQFGSKTRILEPRKRRVITTNTIDYMQVNK
jgi:hypothetical protein